MAFLFRENRRQGADERTDERTDAVQHLMRTPREGYIINFLEKFLPGKNPCLRVGVQFTQFSTPPDTGGVVSGGVLNSKARPTQSRSFRRRDRAPWDRPNNSVGIDL